MSNNRYVKEKESIKKYYKKNKEKIKLWYKQKYCVGKNKEVILKRVKKWRADHKERDKVNHQRRRLECINSWIGIVPQETNCEICGRIIFYKGHARLDTIHFDHKHENYTIKDDPSNWMQSKFCNEKNKKIWESCNFGYLCNKCNSWLPTKNRKEWLRKAVEYANKS